MRRASPAFSVLPALLSAVLIAPEPARAAWPNSPFTNLPVCTATNQQQSVRIVGDGAGGAILVWFDARTGVTYDIYAQHVLASGAVDPAWPADGRALCTAAGDQMEAQLIADGAGGAIVAWYDNRFGTYDIYVHHVLATGVPDPAWPANGRSLAAATSDQAFPQIVTDGSGGAIVSWHDYRGANADIYAHRVLASGAVDPAWPSNGRALCSATGDQVYTQLVSDGAGGAVVAWYDYRSGNADIYAQRILATGVVDPAWPVNGRALCTATGEQSATRIATDGAGGAIVTWMDVRGASADVYAQRVLISGVVDATWPPNGRALCAAAGDQVGTQVISDGAGGAIAAWYDYRSGVPDIYAHHVLASGVTDPAWPADGRAVSTAVDFQADPQLVTDGAGGAIVGWHDRRSVTHYDIYAQHVLSSGAVDTGWPVNGRAVCTTGGNQVGTALVSDGAGGAIATWYDLRNSVNYDIYAQRVARYSYLGTPEAEITAVADVPGDQGGQVKLSWNASYLQDDPYNVVTSYRVYRSVPPFLAAAMLRGGARVVPAHALGLEEIERPGELLATTSAGTTYYWEFLATVPVDFLAGYSWLAPTEQDSMAAGAPATAFMVQSRTAGAQHWESLPAFGRSVDNLAPAAPAPFTGQYAAGTTQLHWNPNTEADLAGYRLYRGAFAGFVPGPGNLVATPPDTGYADAAGTPQYYKLTAVDEHGNESPVATLLPAGTTDVEGGAVTRELSLAAPWPNPAGRQTTLRYALPRAGLVRLAVFDAAGRLVRELASGVYEPGEQAATWDLRDGNGNAVGAGLYFARLEAGGMTKVRRIAVAR